MALLCTVRPRAHCGRSNYSRCATRDARANSADCWARIARPIHFAKLVLYKNDKNGVLCLCVSVLHPAKSLAQLTSTGLHSTNFHCMYSMKKFFFRDLFLNLSFGVAMGLYWYISKEIVTQVFDSSNCESEMTSGSLLRCSVFYAIIGLK